MSEKVETQVKNINGALYDKNGHLIGHAPFDDVQIDTLSYVPLSDKVLQILTGDPNFHAEDINEEYDEPEAENWENLSDEIEVDPIDEYADKSDIFDLKKQLQEKIEVSTSIVVEGVDNPEQSENLSQQLENNQEEQKVSND